MPKLENLHDLLILELQDLYSAETQLVKALPKLAKAASDENLRTLFNDHLEETKEHVSRLERIADLLEFSPKGQKCQGMEGLIAEGAERIDDESQPSVRDAALICAAQKAEHYEISSYGTLRTFAELLGYDEVAELLQETKEEEIAADEKLSGVAGDINVEAEEEPEEND